MKTKFRIVTRRVDNAQVVSVGEPIFSDYSTAKEWAERADNKSIKSDWGICHIVEAVTVED